MKYEDDDPPGMIPLPFGCLCGDMYVSTYCMTMHLVLVVPGLGFFFVFILWLSNKDRNRTVDRHGKAAANWVFSILLYFVAFFSLTLYYPPLFKFLPVLAVVYYLFPIIAAARAYDGKYWRYPLSIPFFRES